MLIVLEFAEPPAPVSVGAVLNIIVEIFEAGVDPRFVPRKSIDAPAVRAKLANVSVVGPPAPGVTVTVL
jgi:hypothetical protein